MSLIPNTDTVDTVNTVTFNSSRVRAGTFNFKYYFSFLYLSTFKIYCIYCITVLLLYKMRILWR